MENKYKDYSMVRIRDLVKVPFSFLDRTEHVLKFVEYLLKDEQTFIPLVLRPYFSQVLDKPVLLSPSKELLFAQGFMDHDENGRTWSTFFMDGSLLSQEVKAEHVKAMLYFAKGTDNVNLSGILNCTDPWLKEWACETNASVFDLSKDYTSLHQKHRYDIRKAPVPAHIQICTTQDLNRFMPSLACGWSFCYTGSSGEHNGFQQAIIWRWVQAGIHLGSSVMLSLYNEQKSLVSVVGAYYQSGYWQFTSLWQPLDCLTLQPTETYGVSSINALIQHLKAAVGTGKLLLTVPSWTGKSELESYEAYKRKFEHHTVPVYSWFARNGPATLPCYNLETQQIMKE